MNNLHGFNTGTEIIPWKMLYLSYNSNMSEYIIKNPSGLLCGELKHWDYDCIGYNVAKYIVNNPNGLKTDAEIIP